MEALVRVVIQFFPLDLQVLGFLRQHALESLLFVREDNLFVPLKHGNIIVAPLGHVLGLE